MKIRKFDGDGMYGPNFNPLPLRLELYCEVAQVPLQTFRGDAGLPGARRSNGRRRLLSAPPHPCFSPRLNIRHYVSLFRVPASAFSFFIYFLLGASFLFEGSNKESCWLSFSISSVDFGGQRVYRAKPPRAECARSARGHCLCRALPVLSVAA